MHFKDEDILVALIPFQFLKETDRFKIVSFLKGLIQFENKI